MSIEGRRVAILLPDLRLGGVERVRLLLAAEFIKRGLKVDLVLGRASGELLDQVPDGCRQVNLEAPRLRRILPALRDYLKRERPDGMLASVWPLTGIACLALRLSRAPCALVVSEHNDFRLVPAITRFEKSALRLFGPRFYAPASRVIAVSQGVADSLQKCARLGRTKIRVIHNPVRLPNPRPLPAEDQPLLDWWEAGGPRLLTIGSLKRQKAHDVLIRALAALGAYPDALLLILGEGPLRAETERLAAQLGLDQRVWLPGFRVDPDRFLERADLFVLSSSWEGFGNVLVEAMACGTPVVSTDCMSGPREILQDGAFGHLVPPGDPQALAQGIARALAAPTDPERLKRRAGDFTVAAAADAYLEELFGTAR